MTNSVAGRKHMYWLCTIALLTSLCSAPTAQAQQSAPDRCRDVLRDGVMKTWKSSENAYFQQLVYREFASSTYDESKSKKAFGLDATVGQYVFGGDYSEDQFKKKQKEIHDWFGSQTTATQRIDIAVTSGDPDILAAWTTCIKNNGGGLAIRTETVSAREVNVFVDWYASSGVNETRLTQNVVLPRGARRKTNGRCIRAGARIVNSVGCVETIVLPSALTDANLVATSANGNATRFVTT